MKEIEILLVEDDPHDAELALHAFAKHRLANHVSLERDGAEAFEAIFGDGDARTRTIPVVVLTSSAEDCDVVESYHLGANSYIVKPVDFEGFTDAVRELGFYWLLLNRPPVDPGGVA